MEQNERIRHLEYLVGLVRNLSESMEVEAFFQLVISAACEMTGSEIASILEPDEESTQLHFLATPWFHRDLLRSVKVPIDASLAGWVFQNVKPIIVADVTAEPRHFKGVDEADGFETRSLLAVPIVYKGETLGVLEASNKAGQRHYSEEDVSLLETLAALAAIAIQNTRQMSKVKESFDEMGQLDQMKSDFIAIASHELRTPLGLILGHAASLREAVAEEQRSDVDIIVRNAMSLKEIIDNIANLDNIRRGITRFRHRPASMRRIVEEVLDSFVEEAHQKGVSMSADISPDNLVVECDASKITIVLSNLVKNAVAFTESGGHVQINVEQIPSYVKVSVIDQGIGIPAKDLPHIFERFYQVESHLTRKHGGIGLGLSVARLMVELHSGRIWAESVEGKGSTFNFILPHVPAQAEGANKVFIT
jgi:signal transduction histidine kinase